jgi:hypothetical protein
LSKAHARAIDRLIAEASDSDVTIHARSGCDETGINRRGRVVYRHPLTNAQIVGTYALEVGPGATVTIVAS